MPGKVSHHAVTWVDWTAAPSPWLSCKGAAEEHIDAAARGADAAGVDCVAYLSARNHGVSQPRLWWLAAISTDALAISLLAGLAFMQLSAMMHAIHWLITFTPHEFNGPVGA